MLSILVRFLQSVHLIKDKYGLFAAAFQENAYLFQGVQFDDPALYL